MNNRTQQRFDKSIREAITATEAAKATASADGLKRKQARARLEIPRIERLIADRRTKSGAPLSKADIKELKAMLDHRQKLLSVEVS